MNKIVGIDDEVLFDYNILQFNVPKISKKYNVSISTIRRILKDNGVVLDRNKKYNIDDKYFDFINNEEKAYWLGFLMADGSVQKDRHLMCELSNKDYSHLRKLKHALKSSHVIKQSKKNCAYLFISSQRLVSSCKKWGLVCNKTRSVKTPNISKSLLCHFYRGILDGDGWITHRYFGKKRIFSFEIGFSSANIDFLKEIQKWIEDSINRKCGYIISRNRHNGSVCQLTIGGNILFLEVINLLYPKSCVVFLDRKKEIIEESIVYLKNLYATRENSDVSNSLLSKYQPTYKS